MPVGRRRGMFADPERSDWDGAGPRPIAWTAWYPTWEGVTEADPDTASQSQSLFLSEPIAPDAPVDPGRSRFPVVLLSHGTGGSALAFGWLGRRLAEAGFVALAPNHHGNTAEEPYRAEGFLCWWERARDLTVLLDHLDQHGDLAGRLDPDRVFAAGFSLGGHTALAALGAVTDIDQFRAYCAAAGVLRGPREFPDIGDRVADLFKTSAVFNTSWARRGDDYRDTRIRAALLCAPAGPVRAFTAESLSRIDRPVTITVGAADAEAPPGDCSVWLHRSLPHAELDWLPAEAGHGVFLPEPTERGRLVRPDLCVDPPSVDRRLIHQQVAAKAIALFSS